MPSNSQGNNGGRQYSFLNRPVLVDCSFIVDSANTNGLGIKNLQGAGVSNVFMYTSQTPATGNPMGQTASKGFIQVQLANNYNRFAGLFDALAVPTTGSALAINSTALTVGVPYVISAVGHAAAGAATITTIADSSGSLASKYFRLLDAYGNVFVIWFSVTGIASAAPIGVSGTLVQVTVAQNATNSQVATALSAVIALLPSGISGVTSFTSSPASAVVTVTNTSTNPYQLPGPPIADTSGFTVALTVNDNNRADWVAVGLPVGIVPAVGAAFIATATGSGSSTGTVLAASVSGLSSLEIIGDPNQTIQPRPVGSTPHIGGTILLKTLAATSSSVTTPLATPPADGTLIRLTFMLEAGSVIIKGE